MHIGHLSSISGIFISSKFLNTKYVYHEKPSQISSMYSLRNAWSAFLLISGHIAGNFVPRTYVKMSENAQNSILPRDLHQLKLSKNWTPRRISLLKYAFTKVNKFYIISGNLISFFVEQKHPLHSKTLSRVDPESAFSVVDFELKWAEIQWKFGRLLPRRI